MNSCRVVFVLVFLYGQVNGQDRIIKRELESGTDFDKNLTITRIYPDTIFYMSYGRHEKIATKDVIAYKRDYKDNQAGYYYPKPGDERIYGIKNHIPYFKADYRYSSKYPEWAKACFLEKFRVYDSIVSEKLDVALYLMSKEFDEKIRVPEIGTFYITVKNDKVNRSFKAKLHRTSSDTTHFYVKITTENGTFVYRFESEDIASLGIESAGARVGRVALHLASLGRAVQFSKDRWLTKYDFPEWYLCK